MLNFSCLYHVLAILLKKSVFSNKRAKYRNIMMERLHGKKVIRHDFFLFFVNSCHSIYFILVEKKRGKRLKLFAKIELTSVLDWVVNLCPFLAIRYLIFRIMNRSDVCRELS